MEVYTVIRYEFANNKLIYSGTNKELAYKKLHSHRYNGLHTWVNDQEISYRTKGLYQEYEYRNGKKKVVKEERNS